MRIVTTLFVAVFCSGTVSGQSFVWVDHANVNYTMNPDYPDFAIALDESNSRVFNSRMTNSGQIVGQEVFGEQLIECRDLDGAVLWSYPLGNQATASRFTVDASGNLLVTGNFLDTLLLGSTDSIFNTGGLFNTNAFLIKLDINGNLVWKRNLALTWPFIVGVSAMTLDPSGFVWFAHTDFQVGEIVQIDNNGNDLFTHTIENAKSIGNISFDPWGGLYVSGGASNGIFVMNTDTFLLSDQYNMFVARFQPGGQPHWATFAHDITFQKPVVIADDFGSALVTGFICDSTSFGSVHFPPPALFCDFFATKTDSSGNFQWGLAQPPLLIGPFGEFEMGKNLHAGTDAAGNFYFSGIQRGTVDWGNGFVSSTPAFSDRRISVVKVNPAGSVQWVKMGGSPDINIQHSLATAANGDCYFTGFAGDSAVFDTISITSSNFRNFVVGKISSTISSLPDQETASGFPFYNQGNGILIIDDLWLGARLSVYDARGAVIAHKTVIADRETDLSALPAGIYLIRLEKNGISAAGKWIHATR
jgi:hypothetical protein